MIKWLKCAVPLLAAGILGGCLGVPDPPAANASIAFVPEQTGRKRISQELPEDLTYAEGTVLRMATGYNSRQTGLGFDKETAGDGVTLADGVTYYAGDLKPTWKELEKRLNIRIEDKYQGNSSGMELAFWKDRMDEIDMVSGSTDSLTEYGEAGKLVDLSGYLPLMPNLRAYLEENPIVRLSITGNNDIGSFYVAPYSDGHDDVERMPLMRIDWIEKLLDGDGPFEAEICGRTGKSYYQPYMPISGKKVVYVVRPDGADVEKLVKDYDAGGNIIRSMNAVGSMSGVRAVNMFRSYIDRTYHGYYGSKRSDLFAGQNAAWDADELVALLRCIKANAYTLNGTDTVQGIFTRDDGSNQRRGDLFRFAGQLFGVRGMESCQDYLYIDVYGRLRDARQEPDSYRALGRMHDLVCEGLLSESFVNKSPMTGEEMLRNDQGFMQYDYNQTQTVYNETVLQKSEGERYMAVLLPISSWQDGVNGNKYMRFTESWRSVKQIGWAISADGVKDHPDRLYAALKLIDYAYSPEGKILMSYGPDEFIRKNADGSYKLFSFKGEMMPEISDATYAELWSRSGGNYTDYCRRYLGSTLSFEKSQALEYQCLSSVGKQGADQIAAAISLGVIKHPELEITSNPWYTSVPTVFPSTKRELDLLSIHKKLEDMFSQSENEENRFVDVIIYGFDGRNADQLVAEIRKEGGQEYLEVKQQTWTRLQASAKEQMNEGRQEKRLKKQTDGFGKMDTGTPEE